MRVVAIAVVVVGCGRLRFDPLQVAPDAASDAVAACQVSVGAGRLHLCAVRGDRTLACWGDGSYGQLGDGDATSSPVPVQVGLAGVKARSSAGAST